MKNKKKFEDNVGDYICFECGVRFGKHRNPMAIATYYEGHCDYCDTDKIVTESRDFCYPLIPERYNVQTSSDK